MRDRKYRRRFGPRRSTQIVIDALEPRRLMCAPGDLIGAPTVVPDSSTVTQPVASGTLHPLTSIPSLNSDPGALATIYLDFHGEAAQSWFNQQVPATPAYDNDGDPTTFSDSELANIQQIWARVAEKYSPFNINVTTVDPGNWDYTGGSVNHHHAIREVIGGDGSWTGGLYGGIAYVGSYSASYLPNTVYVFPANLANGDPHYTAEDTAHEAGHAFGLEHQSTYDSGGNKTNEYNPGNSSTAPIMGNSLSNVRGLWWYGQSSDGATVMQDDLAVISGNDFGYRAEDHGQSLATADALGISGTSVSGSGVITSTSDSDYFRFTTGAGSVTLTANVAQFGPMLHAKIQLFDALGNLVATGNSSTTLGQSITTTLSPGTYYLAVQSYGQYGDVGQYTISGTISPAVASNPILTVSGAASVNEGSPYTLNLSATDPGYTIQSWTIDWGDGSAVQTITGNPSLVTHVYADGPNSFTINATATDDMGTYGANALAVIVNNVPPTIGLSGNAIVNEGNSYALTLGSVSDPGQDTVSQFIVHWGDGTTDTYTANGLETHVFAGSGAQTITVDLVDEDGAWASAAALPIWVSPVTPVGTVTMAKSWRLSTAGLAAPPMQPAYYELNADLTTKLTLSLSRLKDYVSVEVVNQAGQVVLTRTSKHSISFAGTLTPGTYYVRVTMVGLHDTLFGLSLSAKTKLPLKARLKRHAQ